MVGHAIASSLGTALIPSTRHQSSTLGPCRIRRTHPKTNGDSARRRKPLALNRNVHGLHPSLAPFQSFARRVAAAATSASSSNPPPEQEKLVMEIPEIEEELTEEELGDDGEGSENTQPPMKGPSGFVVRAVFGVLLGLVGGTFLYNGGWMFATLISLVAYECVREYYGFIKNMSKRNKYKRPPLPLRRTSGLCCLAIVLGTQYGIRSGLFEVASFVMLAMMVVIRREKLSVRFSAITTLVFGLFYCGYLPSFWVRVRALSIPAKLTVPNALSPLYNLLQGKGLSLQLTGAASFTVEAGLVCTLLPVLCIIAADTFAYLGGRAFGKTPLIALSPKKTVEGAVAGMTGAMTLAVLFNFVFGWPGSYLGSLLLGLCTFVSSVFGDLIESSMKREAGMKDSGALIPGHGGLLDRFDSYLFTGVIVHFFWYWFYWYSGTPLVPLRPLWPISY